MDEAGRPMVELHLGDCLDVLPTLAAGSVDLTVTSPPYDNLRTYNGYTFDAEATARELWRVTKSGGVVVWVVGDATVNGSESLTSFKQAIYFVDGCGFNLHDTMIYEKSGVSYPEEFRYHQAFEFMFVFSKGYPGTTNMIKDRPNKYVLKRSDEYQPRRKFGQRYNVWRYITGGGNIGDELAHTHPAPFPEDLARDHILSWSNPGDLVLDPMMGSGTTGKMAVKYERNFVGIEVSSDYLAIAQRRIRDAQAQLTLPLEFGK